MDKKYLKLTIIFAFLILISSIIPEIEEGGIKLNSGLVLHLFSYCVLSFLILKTAGKYEWAILIAGTYGVFVELIQLGVPYRNFEFFDIITNYIGASLIMVPKIKKKDKKKA